MSSILKQFLTDDDLIIEEDLDNRDDQYRDIYTQLDKYTNGFTKESGEYPLGSKSEVENAEVILKDHYANVRRSGIVDYDVEIEDGMMYKISFSNPINKDVEESFEDGDEFKIVPAYAFGNVGESLDETLHLKTSDALPSYFDLDKAHDKKFDDALKNGIKGYNSFKADDEYNEMFNLLTKTRWQQDNKEFGKAYANASEFMSLYEYFMDCDGKLILAQDSQEQDTPYRVLGDKVRDAEFAEVTFANNGKVFERLKGSSQEFMFDNYKAFMRHILEENAFMLHDDEIYTESLNESVKLPSYRDLDDAYTRQLNAAGNNKGKRVSATKKYEEMFRLLSETIWKNRYAIGGRSYANAKEFVDLFDYYVGEVLKVDKYYSSFYYVEDNPDRALQNWHEPPFKFVVFDDNGSVVLHDISDNRKVYNNLGEFLKSYFRLDDDDIKCTYTESLTEGVNKLPSYKDLDKAYEVKINKLDNKHLTDEKHDAMKHIFDVEWDQMFDLLTKTRWEQDKAEKGIAYANLNEFMELMNYYHESAMKDMKVITIDDSDAFIVGGDDWSYIFNPDGTIRLNVDGRNTLYNNLHDFLGPNFGIPEEVVYIGESLTEGAQKLPSYNDLYKSLMKHIDELMCNNYDQQKLNKATRKEQDVYNKMFDLLTKTRWKQDYAEAGRAYANANEFANIFNYYKEKNYKVKKSKDGTYIVNGDLLNTSGSCRAVFNQDGTVEIYIDDDKNPVKYETFKDLFDGWFYAGFGKCYTESLNESPDEYGLPTYKELRQAQQRKYDKGEESRPESIEHFKEISEIKNKARWEKVKADLGKVAADFDEMRQVMIDRYGEKRIHWDSMDDQFGTSYVLYFEGGGLPDLALTFRSDGTFTVDSPNKTINYKSFKDYVDARQPESIYTESLNESPDEYGLPTYKELSDAAWRRSKDPSDEKEQKEFKDMKKLLRQERRNKIIDEYGSVGYANADTYYQWINRFGMQGGMSEPRKEDYGASIVIAKPDGEITTKFNFFNDNSMEEEERTTGEIFSYDTFDQYMKQYFSEFRDFDESLNESPDEYGLPTFKELRSAGEKKQSSQKERQDMHILKSKTRWKMAKERYNEAYANGDQIGSYLSYIYGYDRVLKSWHGTYYEVEVYGVPFIHDHKILFYPNSVYVNCADTNRNKEYRSYEEFVNEYFGGDEWDPRTKELFMNESLNESPDEFGLPTYNELSDAGRKKNSPDDEKREMAILKSKTRWKEAKKKYGEVYANGDQLRQYFEHLFGDNHVKYTWSEQGGYYYVGVEDVPGLPNHIIRLWPSGMVYVSFNDYSDDPDSKQAYNTYKDFIDGYFGNPLWNPMTKELFMNEAVEKHDELNPDLWENNALKPEVKDKLLEIVQKFDDNLKQDGIELDIKDVKLIGSNASYNYNDTSDIDLHIIADTSVYDNEELALKVYQAYKSLWNNKYDPTIYGHEVEIYVEPYNEEVSNEG